MALFFQRSIFYSTLTTTTGVYSGSLKVYNEVTWLAGGERRKNHKAFIVGETGSKI